MMKKLIMWININVLFMHNNDVDDDVKQSDKNGNDGGFNKFILCFIM